MVQYLQQGGYLGKERLLRILEWYRLKDRQIDHYSLATNHYSLATYHYSPARVNSFQTDTDSPDRYRQIFKSYYCLLACVKRDLIDSRDLKDSQTDADKLLLISTNFHTTDRLTWVKFTYSKLLYHGSFHL